MADLQAIVSKAAAPAGAVVGGATGALPVWLIGLLLLPVWIAAMNDTAFRVLATWFPSVAQRLAERGGSGRKGASCDAGGSGLLDGGLREDEVGRIRRELAPQEPDHLLAERDAS